MGARGVILVISDDAGAAAGAAAELRAILRDNRFTVVSSGGDVADTRAALAHTPDLVVVDTELGHGDPFDLVADLHLTGLAHDLPVVFMAPEGDVERRVRSLECGDDLISTPLGAVPGSDVVRDLVELDDHGFVLTGQDLIRDGRRPRGWTPRRDPFVQETSVPGIFAAGDVRHDVMRRVASAVGQGAVSVSLVHQYLDTV